MNNLKICIVTFHNGFDPGTVGGGSSAPIYLADQLRHHFKTVDLISLRYTKDYLSPIAAEVAYHKDADVLDNYDFVIFSAPGLTYEKYDENNADKYIDILNHAKSFTFMCHEENDRQLYPYYKNFLTHPNIKFVTFNCPTMGTYTFTDYVDTVGDWDYVSFCPTMPAKEVVMEKATEKKDKIMSTCRWTTSKRVYEYLSMAKDFVDNGIEVYAAGSHQSYWYNLKMAELPTEYYTDLGYFEPSQVPSLLSDVKYHWNFLFQLRSMGLKSHQPRLEIATMEAIREGCLPVICKEFTPDWVGEDAAVRISKDNYTDLPKILGSMTDEERLNRIDTLYDRVMNHIHDRYESYSAHIMRYFE